MRIQHRLGIVLDLYMEFLRIGIDLKDHDIPAGGSFAVVVLDEEDPRWPSVKKIMSQHGILGLEETYFTDIELDQAPAVSFLSKSFGGYPEPSDDFGYRSVTYDPSEFCFECGVGLRQVAPFRLAREPKWAKRTTTQLHWVMDEIFVSREAWEKVFRPFGIDCWPVHSRRDVPYPSTVQLRIDAMTDVVMPPELQPVTCPICKRDKYPILSRGFWPKPESIPAAAFKSIQYTGSDHSADRILYASHELFESMRKAKLNCRYWACAD